MGGKARNSGTKLTREGVARRLGVSIPTVRRMEARSELNATRGAHGAHQYDPTEVEARATGRTSDRVDGPTSAQAFGLFDAGVGWRQVVVKLQVTPAIARYLWAEWKTPLGAPGPTPPWRMPATDTGSAPDDRDLEEWERQMRQQQAAQDAECREEDEARVGRRALRFRRN
jgi:hypothetical protein